MIRALIFDWGGTVMADYDFPGAMYLWPGVDWVPGAKEALDKLSPAFVCCIATNAGISGTPEMILALDRVDASKYFRYFFSSKELGVRKPDPRFFEMICNRIHMTPGECITIGDNYAKDITGALNAGMKAVFYDPAGDSVMPDPQVVTIRSMAELPLAVERIKQKENDL